MRLDHGDLVHVRTPETGSIDLARYACYECHFGDDTPHIDHDPHFQYFGTEYISYPGEVEVVEKLAVRPAGRR